MVKIRQTFDAKYKKCCTNFHRFGFNGPVPVKFDSEYYYLTVIISAVGIATIFSALQLEASLDEANKSHERKMQAQNILV